MKVTSLEISNFRGIRQARFAFHKRLNVFAGAHGSGKTSLLTCLAMLLSRLTVPIAAPTRFGRRFAREDIAHGADAAWATVCVEFPDCSRTDRSCTWTAGRSLHSEKHSLSRLEEVRRLSAEISRRLDADQGASVPLVCLYAQSRDVESVPLGIRRGQPRPDQVEALEKSLSERRAGEVEKELARMAALITDEDFDEMRRSAQALAHKTGNIPALLKVNAVLTMLGEKQADLVSIPACNGQGRSRQEECPDA